MKKLVGFAGGGERSGRVARVRDRRANHMGHRTSGARLIVLGSGSAGNATLVTQGMGIVLVDVGLSYRRVVGRLESVSVRPADVGAIVITHAHGDHTRGAALFSRKHDVPVYTTHAVWSEWGRPDVAEWRPLIPAQSRSICGLGFEPLTVPHDACETVAFRIETSDGLIGFATDVGVMTPQLVERFRDCRVLVLESNHALDLLAVSPYNYATRARIASAFGHLSNESVAAFVRTELGSSVRCIVLAHLSQVNNLPELAEMTCREALAACGRSDVDVLVARQDYVTPPVALGAWSTRGADSRPSLAWVQTELPFGSVLRTTDHRRASMASADKSQPS